MALVLLLLLVVLILLIAIVMLLVVVALGLLLVQCDGRLTRAVVGWRRTHQSDSLGKYPLLVLS